MTLTITKIAAEHPPLKEVAKFIFTHLLNQGVQSMRQDASCMYQGSEGRTCAVGCLIESNISTSGVEGIGWVDALPGLYPIDIVQKVDYAGGIFDACQDAHDALPTSERFSKEYFLDHVHELYRAWSKGGDDDSTNYKALCDAIAELP